MVDALKTDNLTEVFACMYNGFEAAIYPERPEAHACYTLLSECADRALLSGSGSAVIGLFTDRDRAEMACKRLTDAGAAAYLCTTL